MIANAVIFTERNVVDYRSITCPDPGPNDAVVRVTHSWISNGTEGSFSAGERIEGDTAYQPGDRTPFPIVAGYQKIGVVESVGAEIKDIVAGETVFCIAGRVSNMFKAEGGHVAVRYPAPIDLEIAAKSQAVGIRRPGVNAGRLQLRLSRAAQ